MLLQTPNWQRRKENPGASALKPWVRPELDSPATAAHLHVFNTETDTDCASPAW